MSIWQRLKDYSKRLWRKIVAGFKSPSTEFVAGANSGAAIGRVFLWSWLSAMSFALGLPFSGVVALAMALWESWLAIQVFREISLSFFLQTGDLPATARVVRDVPTVVAV